MFEVTLWEGTMVHCIENYIPYTDALRAFRKMQEDAAVMVAKKALGLDKVTIIEGGPGEPSIVITRSENGIRITGQ